MKWYEILLTIAGAGTLVQLISWIFNTLGIEKILGKHLTFFISLISIGFLILILLINQLQSESKKMKEFLKTKGFKENGGFIEKMFSNKKGYMLDARILWILFAAGLLYFIYKVSIG